MALKKYSRAQLGKSTNSLQVPSSYEQPSPNPQLASLPLLFHSKKVLLSEKPVFIGAYNVVRPKIHPESILRDLGTIKS